MKRIVLLASIILTGFAAVATTTTKGETTATYMNGYGNSFIFVEGGIEFSVFPDGQFDFNILGNRSNLNVSIGSPHVNISFNSGYDYNTYVQYDEYGAVIQIENTPIYYDYYGRINRAGNVNINYNNYGYISRVGGLYVHYNQYNVFSHCSGFINIYNQQYVYRPWHRYYSMPAYDYRVVYSRPYRQYYKPVRYSYNKPYYNNHRPRTSVATRRGSSIERNRHYATANRMNTNRSDPSQLRTNSSNRRDYAKVENNQRVHRDNYRNQSDDRRDHDRADNRVNNNNFNKTRETVRRTHNPGTDIKRSQDVMRDRNNSASQKPNASNTRTYHKTITRSTPKVAERSTQSKTRVTSSNNNSRNNSASQGKRRL